MSIEVKSKKVYSNMSLAEEYCLKSEKYIGMKLESIGLNISAINYLFRARVYTVGDLLKLSESQLYDIKNIGKGSIQKIRESIEQLIKSEQKLMESKSSNNKERANFIIDKNTYKTAMKIIGYDICREAYLHPEMFIPLIQSFNSFSAFVLERRKVVKEIISLQASVPKDRLNKKAYPFIKAYSNNDEKVNLLKNIYEKDSLVSNFNLEKNYDEKVLNELKHFLDWLHFDLEQIVSSFIEHLSDDKELMEVLMRRIDGHNYKKISTELNIKLSDAYTIGEKLSNRIRIFIIRYNLIDMIIALNNGNEVIDVVKISEYFGKYKDSVLHYIRKINRDSGIYYNNRFDVVCSTMNAYLLVNRVNNLLEDTIFVDVFDESVNEVVNQLDLPEETVRLVIHKSFTKYGSVYVSGILTNKKVYSIILKQYFPKGIKLTDLNELKMFCEKITECFGDYLMTVNNNNLVAGIKDIGVMCDKSSYIHRDHIVVSEKVISTIEDYLLKSKNNEIKLSDLYLHFYKLLKKESNITNWYMLQGVLKLELNNKFFFRYGKIIRCVI